MAQPKTQKIVFMSVADLVVDRGINFRDEYDLPSMVDSIWQKGRIEEPIHAMRKSKKVLRGNRRTGGGQIVLRDPNCPPELRKQLENTPVILHDDEDFADEKDLVTFVLDHGGQKPLSRTEIIKAVWKLTAQMYSEKEIASILFQQLARFTGKAQKAWEAAQLPAGPTRDEFVRNWLHGTLGNYILPAGAMGAEVREQFLLTELGNDRPLSDEEKKKRTMDCNRAAIKRLNTAKTKDREEKGWNATEGGIHFNAELQKLKDEFGKPKSSDKKITTDAMISTSENMQSAGMRLPFLACAGKLEGAAKAEMVNLDAEYARRDKVLPVLQANVEKITDEKVKALILAIVSKSDTDVSAALEPFLAK